MGPFQAAEAPQFVLASASPRRRSILRRAGYRFRVAPSGAAERDEGLVLSGIETAMFNATVKALAGARASGGLPVLAADTVVDLNGRLLGKPAGLDEARAMLRALSGRAHLVTTAVVLWRPDGGACGRSRAASVTSVVEFHPLEDAEIERYIREVNPLDKAGAYGAQESSGVRLIRRVAGPLDNVYGLPLGAAASLLAWAGIRPVSGPAPGAGIPEGGR